QSASFPERLQPAGPDARLVSSQSFPHLWKKLWKFSKTSRHNAMNVWDQILSRIESKMNRHTFYTWFRPTAFVSEDRTSVTVRVPNLLFQEWLTKHYWGVITEAMAELRKPNLIVNFVPESQTDATIPLSADEAAAFDETLPSTQPGPAGLNPRYTFDTFIV